MHYKIIDNKRCVYVGSGCPEALQSNSMLSCSRNCISVGGSEIINGGMMTTNNFAKIYVKKNTI